MSTPMYTTPELLPSVRNHLLQTAPCQELLIGCRLKNGILDNEQRFWRSMHRQPVGMPATARTGQQQPKAETSHQQPLAATSSRQKPPEASGGLWWPLEASGGFWWHFLPSKSRRTKRNAILPAICNIGLQPTHPRDRPGRSAHSSKIRRASP